MTVFYTDTLSVSGYGTLDITRHYPQAGQGGIGWITIDHADPRIRISHLALQEIDRAPLPHIRLDKTCACLPRIGCGHFKGARLEIRASNRGVIYLIGEMDPDWMWWQAEWPD